MTLFDAEISVLKAVVGVPSPEMLEQGATPVIELALVAGLALPIANPTTGEPLLAAVGQFRYEFTKEQALAVFSEALKAAESLPDPKPTSGLLMASNMADVERAAAQIKKVTGP